VNKEILLVVDMLSNEKGIEKLLVLEAIESALAMATRKKHNMDMDVRVELDHTTGAYKSFRRWLVLDDEDMVKNSEAEVLQEKILDKSSTLEVGDYWEEEIPSVAFGRIAAQTAKQVIVQKVREAERAKVVDQYLPRKGELVTGTVKRADRNNVIIDLGNNAEALIPRDEMIPRESVRPGDRLRGYLKDVRPELKGPQLYISRTAPEFLIELFKLEVPEIGENLIEIMGAARDPGSRAKIAVRTNDDRLDPIGSCVGMRGARVQAVSNEIAGERVDIVLWNENPAQFVIHAMSPAEVVSLSVDEDTHSMDVAVVEEQLSQAIGRGGQNIRLAVELTGWTLNVMSEGDAEQKTLVETQASQQVFVDDLNVDEDVAAVLVQEGFSSIEEIAYIPLQEMLEIEEFDEEIIKELRSRAKDVLLTKALTNDSDKPRKQQSPADDLLALDGMNKSLASLLAKEGIASREDLAELATDDLLDVVEVDRELASSLIMAARAPWFEQQN
jgi:transcription termination/antitermination protein NusA